MIYMLSLQQKQMAKEEAKVIPKLIIDNEKDVESLRSFYMALTNYVAKTSPTARLKSLSLPTVQEMLDMDNLDEFKQYLEQLFIHIVNVGTDELEDAKVYTTGELAKFFGVSVQSINKWIQQGRIAPVEKQARFKQVRVSENAIYTASNGTRMPIHEVVRLYEEEQSKSTIRPMTQTEEIKEIVDAIVFYEQKYKGEYRQTLGSKEELTPEEARDAHEWRYLLQLLKEVDEEDESM